MIHLNARSVRPHILNLEELLMRVSGRAVKLLGVNDKIHVLDGQFVIRLRRTRNRRC